MTNIIKRMVRVIRKSLSNGKKLVSKKLSINSNHKNKNKHHKGGSVYSFDLNDKIGGMPANVSLNGTIDGDCPKGNLTDLGFTNYAGSGGKRRSKKSAKRSSKKHHSKTKTKTKKNSRLMKH
jgi:hypothetical protein